MSNVLPEGYSMTATLAGRSHVCNCIGCCRRCGQCRTAPWHAKSCDAIARLNAERAKVIEAARS